MNRIDFPWNASGRNGRGKPPKFEPPPRHEITTSGSSPICSNCAFVSSPITVWWSSTWFSTDPRQYTAFSSPRASSSPSLTAMPSDPGCFLSFFRSSRPVFVFRLGDACTSAPYRRIRFRRSAFQSWTARTQYTVVFSPTRAGGYPSPGLLQPDGARGVPEGGAPLPRPGLRRHALVSRRGRVPRLGERGVHLVAPRRREELGLEVHLGRRGQALLQPPRPEQGSGP